MGKIEGGRWRIKVLEQLFENEPAEREKNVGGNGKIKG